MRTFIFECEQLFPVPRAELFPFFADARNLETITPPWLGFEVLTPEPIVMGQGTLIDYRLQWHRVPLHWRTEITAWEPPFRFIDEQIRGPYRLWRHEHIFSDVDEGTLMADRVEYAVPGGRLIHRLFVRADVERIFAYRREVLDSIIL